MPVRTPQTREEWAEHTEPARRIARFGWAVQRCQRIADGTPKLTSSELDQLAALFAEAAGKARQEEANQAFTPTVVRTRAG
jgi:hypothetical protein